MGRPRGRAPSLEVKRFVHPGLGVLELTCQTLLDPAESHALLVHTAVPGSESHEKLELLSVIGTRSLLPADAPGEPPASTVPGARPDGT